MGFYSGVLSQPSAGRLIVGGFLGRLPGSMVPFALLLLLAERTGSYATAGLTSAAYGVALGVAAPVVGRIADRRGPRRILLLQAVAYPTVMALLLVAVFVEAPGAVVLVAAAGAGAVTPLVSGTVRAVWSRVDPQVQPAAFALDAVVVDVSYVAGPGLVGGLALVSSPAVAVGLAAALGAAGALSVGSSNALRAWPPPPGVSSSPLSTVLSPGMPRLLLSGALVMMAFGFLEVAVPAFVDSRGAAGLAGLFMAIWALGSVAGGLWFGTRVIRHSLPTQYRFLILAVSLGMVPLALTSNAWLFAVLLFLSGATLAPFLIVLNTLIGRTAPAHAAVEAFTWFTAIAFGATAIGVALGGAIIETSAGVRGSFLVGVGTGVVAILPMWRTRRSDALFSPRLPGGQAARPGQAIDG